MSTQPTYDILMFGHFAKDRNVVDERAEIASGGAVYYGSVVVRRIGLRVAIVTRAHPDDFARLDELKQEGIGVFAAPASETSGIENTYKSSDMERRVCKLLGFAGAMQSADIPNVTARIYAITPIIAGEFDLAYLGTLAARGPVALDVQGFVRVPEGRDLVSRPWKEMADGLKHVTYLKVDRAEAELLTGETDLARAARKLAAYGPREIVLTQSSGVTVFADGQIHVAPFTPRSLAGRTGRGDTCFMSYLSRRLSHSPGDACRFAAAVTTLKQEKPGPWRGTIADVEAVMRG
ncbi:MAG: PfkB family carbohydrate kinase [Anaerolineales bacterium]|nr:PfkB family carbohydrate kinase [Anaerolineales bacterium]